MSSTAVRAAVPNGIPKPDLDLPVMLASLSIFVFYVELSVPRQARGHYRQYTQAFRACARPVRTSDLYLWPPIHGRYTQPHHGRMDEHDQLSHSNRPNVHPTPPRVHPPLGRARRVGPRRRTQQPSNWKSDGELCPGTVLYRGRTR